MLTAEYILTPIKKTPKAREKLVDTAYSLLASLAKNGQIYGDQIMTWIDGELHITCYVPRPDSLSTEYFSEWARRDYAHILSILSGPPTYRILDDGPIPTRYPRWQAALTLCLFTTFLDITSPVCSGHDGKPVPLYLMPLSDRLKEGITFWQDGYKAMDHLWISSGELEIPAYRQLADPGSGLSERGRRLCEEIEAATGKPTYYYLMRYWGRREGEAARLCPGCGKPWATGVPYRSFFDFAFRCEGCRLVSDEGVDTDDERHARIGEFHESARNR